MVLTCNLGCVGQGATAIAILLDKRFLTSLACGVCGRLSSSRGVVVIVRRDRIGVGLYNEVIGSGGKRDGIRCDLELSC
jgi:hypothetical protein